MIHFHQAFQKLLSSFNSAKVDYLVIGGYAVGFYGYVRNTQDIDFWVGTNPENAAKVIRVLREAGFDEKDITDDFFLSEHQVARFGIKPYQVDILTSVSGLDFKQAFSHRITLDVEGLTVNFISLADLLANKQASARPKDIADIANLPGESTEKKRPAKNAPRSTQKRRAPNPRRRRSQSHRPPARKKPPHRA